MPPISIHWLVDPVRQDARHEIGGDRGASRTEFPMPGNIGHGWVETLPLSTRMSLLHGVHRFVPQPALAQVNLAEYESESPEPTLVVHSVYGGTLIHREKEPQHNYTLGAGMVQFRQAQRLRITPVLDTSRPTEIIALIAGRASLNQLLGEDLADNLLRGLGLAKVPTVLMRRIPQSISVLLEQAVSSSRTGALRELSAQAKVLEYLCALIAMVSPIDVGERRQINIAPPVERRRQRTRDVVMQLREDLSRLQGKLPTLDELSQRYGMSTKLLNDAFQREFGSSIVSFITNHRLNEAHEALLAGNLPIKALAELLGYSHVNHFTTAFTRKFGYPPGSLRRKTKGS